MMLSQNATQHTHPIQGPALAQLSGKAGKQRGTNREVNQGEQHGQVAKWTSRRVEKDKQGEQSRA